MESNAPTLGKYVVRSLRFHWRSALLLALGVAAATAVITGALIVGDSMRGSLRELTRQRLGAIDLVLSPNGFFESQLSGTLEPLLKHEGSQAEPLVVPILLFPTSVLETSSGETLRRSSDVQVVASDERFWALDVDGVRPGELPGDDQVVLNQTAADQLAVQVGDLVTVRLPAEQAVPADNPLGRRDAGTESLPRLEVVAIVPDRGLGRFSLSPSQQNAANAYLPMETVQEILDRDGQANLLLIASGNPQVADPQGGPEIAADLTDRIDLRLEDYGLRLKRVERSFAPQDASTPETIFSYWSLTSDRLLLANEVVQTAQSQLGENHVKPVMTYLANSIMAADQEGDTEVQVPYSMITGIDESSNFPLLELATEFEPSFREAFRRSEQIPAQAEEQEPLPLVLNAWIANKLKVKLGDRLQVRYFKPETVGGQEVEDVFSAVIAGIVPLTEPERPYDRRREATFANRPTRFNDPDLTPEVPGVTDQASILDWDLPFKLNHKIDKEDDQYWNNYRLTPKVFLPYVAAKEKFGSRFGRATSLMIDPAFTETQIRTAVGLGLAKVRSELGWAVQPIKAKQFAASKGSTPFDMLFLALSFFVIVAALLLIALLMRLGFEQRASEYGTLLALGWPIKRVARLAQLETGLVVVLGSTAGLLLGTGYSAMVLHLLRTWWVGAVSVPFLEMHLTPRALLIGWLAGGIMATMTVLWVLRRMSRVPGLRLLRGTLESAQNARVSASPRIKWLAIAALTGGLVLALVAAGLSGQAQAVAFVGEGMLILLGLLFAYRVWLTRRVDSTDPKTVSLIGLASRSGRRHPLRSVLTAGLLAVAGFLILSMGAFRIDPSASGAGGFDLIARSAQPLYRDLDDAALREEALGTTDADLLNQVRFAMLRERTGQDASCNNLYQASQPRVLGIPDKMAGLQQSAGESAFAWAAGDPEAVWTQLTERALGTEADPLPVVIDQNTAMWSLQLRGGLGEVFSYEYDESGSVYFKVIGLLANSLLQGGLLISEGNFVQTFPEVTGYRQVLIRSGEMNPTKVTEILENRLGDAGVDVQETATQLARLLEVQNTYLRTFQGLGALGLLLGTFGLAVAQTRSVMERRGELALLRAVGFTHRRIEKLVMLETSQLLAGGLLVAVVSAMAALVPFAIAGRTHIGWQEPALLLVAVLMCGLVVSSLALRRVLASPLLAALRGS